MYSRPQLLDLEGQLELLLLVLVGGSWAVDSLRQPAEIQRDFGAGLPLNIVVVDSPLDVVVQLNVERQLDVAVG